MSLPSGSPGGLSQRVDGTSVPVWDEDPDETFAGPDYLDRFYAEESETADLFSGEGYEDGYDDDASYSQTLVPSAAQRSFTLREDDGLHAETGSGQTHTDPPSLVGGKGGAYYWRRC